MDPHSWAHIGQEELLSRISQLPPAQVTKAVLSIEDKPRLEAIGRALNADQALELFSSLTNAVKRLSPILVGLPHTVFQEVIRKSEAKNLQALKQEGTTEPVQHQITLYLHTLSKRLKEFDKRYEQLLFAIDSIEIQTLKPLKIRELWRNICTLSEDYLNLMKEMSKVLLLAWNTNREDLIEELTLVKERCHRISRFGIGFPRTAKDEASGLFEQLDEKVFSVYGAPDDILAARDDEPSIEGLTRISAWYLRDYWEAGLLPHIEDPSELDLDKKKYSSDVRREYRERLFHQVQYNLLQSGLETVKDLKNNWIYSKESLAFYLRNQNLNPL